ncbi:Uncharacterised protein [Mycobacteroides abscessus subsp. abscessus]|nr:Uncharacterised protein [Mycobacteroides abscessus subsp. abscessus]
MGARNSKSWALTREIGALVKNLAGKRSSATRRENSAVSSSAVSDCSSRVWRGDRQPICSITAVLDILRSTRA